MLEEEDGTGFTRLTLLASPRLKLDDEGALIDVVLETLRETSAAADVARAFWQHGHTFRVRRAEPYTTARGKQQALHRTRTSDPSRALP